MAASLAEFTKSWVLHGDASLPVWETEGAKVKFVKHRARLTRAGSFRAGSTSLPELPDACLWVLVTIVATKPRTSHRVQPNRSGVQTLKQGGRALYLTLFGFETSFRSI